MRGGRLTWGGRLFQNIAFFFGNVVYRAATASEIALKTV